MRWFRQILRAPREERKTKAKAFDDGLDKIMTGLGVVFLLLVLSERAAPAGSTLGRSFEIAYLALWALFIAEFAWRLIVEPEIGVFLKETWWEIPALLVPFLRFTRLFRLLRLGRAGRLATMAARAGRSATLKLTHRMAWIAVIHMTVVLGGTNLLVEVTSRPFASALHDVALSATTGEPIPGARGLVEVLEVVSALYSVAFFAAIAGAIGSLYIEQGREALRRVVPPKTSESDQSVALEVSPQPEGS